MGVKPDRRSRPVDGAELDAGVEEISRQGPSLDKDQCGPRQIAHAFRPFYMGPAGDFFSTGL